MKNYLFIIRHAPHNGIATQELLDVILTMAAFDQRVSLLFLEDGVLQLKSLQNPKQSGLKDTLSIFKALELYDVQSLYIEAEAAAEYGLNFDHLELPLNYYPRQQIPRLLLQFDIII